MNIYEYFNSPDVANHCKKLGHRFSGKELAYMIWQSNHHTLAQKIAAWEELLKIIPDEPLEDGDSLHHFLACYITRLQQFISEFQAGAENCVYSFETRYANVSDRYLDESALYTSYDVCLCAAMENNAGEVLSFRIRKKQIHSQKADWMGDAMLYLTAKGEPMDLFIGPYYGEIDVLVEPFGFYSWYIKIPTLFKRGDIVTGISPRRQRLGPMVVDKLPSENGEDYLDMRACLWEPDPHGQLRHNEDICYLSLAYSHCNSEKQEPGLSGKGGCA